MQKPQNLKSCRLCLVAAAVVAASCTPNESRPQGGAATPAASGSSEPSTPPASGSASAAAGAAGSAAESPLEQVQRWAPRGAEVAPAELTVPGVELFVVTGPAPAGEGEYTGGTLVGVAAGKLVEGRALVQAVIAAEPAPLLLARIALWVAQRDSEGPILEAATTRAHKQAKVTGPAIKGKQLRFWVETTEAPTILEVGTLDLATGALELEPQPMARDAALANAAATLDGAAVTRHPGAIRTLIAACAEQKPRQVLLSAAARHPRDRTRVAILQQIHKCGDAVVAPLISLMESDRSAMVRPEAASALGRIGDSRARPALARAARGDDANLVWAAKNALGKLQ